MKRLAALLLLATAAAALQCYNGGEFNIVQINDNNELDEWTYKNMTSPPTLMDCQDCCVTATAYKTDLVVPKCADQKSCNAMQDDCAEGTFKLPEPGKINEKPVIMLLRKLCRCDTNGCNKVPVLKCWQGGKFTVSKDPTAKLDTWTGVEEKPELEFCHSNEAHCCLTMTSLTGVVNPMCGSKEACDAANKDPKGCSPRPANDAGNYDFIQDGVTTKVHVAKQCRCAEEGCNDADPCKALIEVSKAECQGGDEEKCMKTADKCQAEECSKPPCAMVGFQKAKCRAKLDTCLKSLKCFDGGSYGKTHDGDGKWSYTEMSVAPSMTLCPDPTGCCVLGTSFGGVPVPKCMDKARCEALTSSLDPFCDQGSLPDTARGGEAIEVAVAKRCKCTTDGCNALPTLDCWQGGDYILNEKKDTWVDVDEAHRPQLQQCPPLQAHCCLQRISTTGFPRPACGSKAECDSKSKTPCAQKAGGDPPSEWLLSHTQNGFTRKLSYKEQCRCPTSGCNAVLKCWQGGKFTVGKAPGTEFDTWIAMGQDSKPKLELCPIPESHCCMTMTSLTGVAKPVCGSKEACDAAGKDPKGCSPRPRSDAGNYNFVQDGVMRMVHVAKQCRCAEEGCNELKPLECVVSKPVKASEVDGRLTVSGLSEELDAEKIERCYNGRHYCCRSARSLAGVEVHLGCSTEAACEQAQPSPDATRGKESCRWPKPSEEISSSHTFCKDGEECDRKLFTPAEYHWKNLCRCVQDNKDKCNALDAEHKQGCQAHVEAIAAACPDEVCRRDAEECRARECGKFTCAQLHFDEAKCRAKLDYCMEKERGACATHLQWGRSLCPAAGDADGVAFCESVHDKCAAVYESAKGEHKDECVAKLSDCVHEESAKGVSFLDAEEPAPGARFMYMYSGAAGPGGVVVLVAALLLLH